VRWVGAAGNESGERMAACWKWKGRLELVRWVAAAGNESGDRMAAVWKWKDAGADEVRRC
jgi:hypothetical protein